MNIMLFCSNPVNGGTARIFLELANNLQKTLWKTGKLFVCINEGNKAEVYNECHELYRLPIISAETIFPGTFGGTLPRRIIHSIIRKCRYRKVQERNIKEVTTFIKQNDITHIIIHNGGYGGDDLCNQVLAAAYQCAEYTMCRVLVFHSDMKKNICAKLRFAHYDRKISREATDIVTVSNYTKNRIQESSFIKKNIEVIYNGISVKSSKAIDSTLGVVSVDRSKNNILMIGNFFENKGQKSYIAAALRLLSDNLNYHFTIIGSKYDEKYYNECMDLIYNSRQKECFTIYENLNNASDYITLFDLIVVPSLYDESFGLISVEAMANSKPVIAYACGGIPEVVIDGRDGFIVPLGDDKALAEKIEWLEKNILEREKIGQQCKKDYENKFTGIAMTERYVNVLRRYL